LGCVLVEVRDVKANRQAVSIRKLFASGGSPNSRVIRGHCSDRRRGLREITDVSSIPARVPQVPRLHQNCVRADLSAVNDCILRFKYSATPAQTSFHFLGVTLDPSLHRYVIDVHAPLGHVAVRKWKTQLPTHGQEDDLRFKLVPLEETGNWGYEEHRPILIRSSLHTCNTSF